MEVELKCSYVKIRTFTCSWHYPLDFLGVLETVVHVHHPPLKQKYLANSVRKIILSFCGWDFRKRGSTSSRNKCSKTCREVLGDTGGWKNGHKLTMCTCSPERQPYPASKGPWSARRGLWVSPSTLLWRDPIWSTAPRSGVPSSRKTC